jgi:hypothetical protein
MLIDPRQASRPSVVSIDRPLFTTREEIRPFLAPCRDGRLYDVERWLAQGKPVQLDPGATRKGYRPPSALEVAIETRRSGSL